MTGYSRVRRGRMAADHFTQIRNALFRDPRLSAKAKGVFGYISTHRDGYGVNPGSIARCMTDGPSAIKTALQELERYGYLYRQQDRDPVTHQWMPATYFITDQPDLVDLAEGSDNTDTCCSGQENPRSDPQVDFPSTDEPLAGNHPPKNTRKKNTKHKNTPVRPSVDARADVCATTGTDGRESQSEEFTPPPTTASTPQESAGQEPKPSGNPRPPVTRRPDPVPPPATSGQPVAATQPQDAGRTVVLAARDTAVETGATSPATTPPAPPRSQPTPPAAPARTPGVELLERIGAQHPGYLLTGQTLADQGLVVTGMLAAGWTPGQVRQVVTSRPLPPPGEITASVGAIIATRLRQAATSGPPLGPRAAPEPPKVDPHIGPTTRSGPSSAPDTPATSGDQAAWDEPHHCGQTTPLPPAYGTHHARPAVECDGQDGGCGRPVRPGYDRCTGCLDLPVCDCGTGRYDPALGQEQCPECHTAASALRRLTAA